MIKLLALSDNYRSIKADLHNIKNKEETNEGPSTSKRLAFSLQSNLGYEYETNLLPKHGQVHFCPWNSSRASFHHRMNANTMENFIVEKLII